MTRRELIREIMSIRQLIQEEAMWLTLELNPELMNDV